MGLLHFQPHVRFTRYMHRNFDARYTVYVVVNSTQLKMTEMSIELEYPQSISCPSLSVSAFFSQDLSDLEECVSELRPGIFPQGFENSMFTGEYLANADLMEGDPGERSGAGVSVGNGGTVGGMGMTGSARGGVVDVI